MPMTYQVSYWVAPKSFHKVVPGYLVIRFTVLEKKGHLYIPYPKWFKKKKHTRYTKSADGKKVIETEEIGFWHYVDSVVMEKVAGYLAAHDYKDFEVRVCGTKRPGEGANEQIQKRA